MRRLLIVGCGDVGRRLLPLVSPRYRVFILTRSDRHHGVIRSLGATPVTGDLDLPGSLRRLAGIAHDVVHMAPPPPAGGRDLRTGHLIQALSRGESVPQRFVYMSTTGVYGDCQGEWVPESRPLNPESDRAVRRAHAERQVRRWGGSCGVRVSILRVPGIYAADRLPLERLRSGMPVLAPSDDPYTNHVHADDLARIVATALARGRAGRAYNTSDQTCLRMGEYFDLVASQFGLPRPPRLSLLEAGTRLPPVVLSFMRESRRLRNDRLRKELRFVFRYPTVSDGLAAAIAKT